VAVKQATPLSTRLLIWALELASAVAGVVPRTVAEPPCRLAGVIWYLTAPAARAAVRDNLRHVLGHAATRRQEVAVFQNGVLNYWDTLAIPHLSPRAVLDLVDIHGREHIDAALTAGRGVIMASAHLGSVAFVGQILPALGYPTMGLLEPLDPPELYEFFARQRQALGARLLPASSGAVRELLHALRRNEVLGLVTDRDVTGTGPRMLVFDAVTRFPDGVAALSLRTGAPILIAVCTRRRNGRFDAWIEPLPSVQLTGDSKADVLAVTQSVVKRLEYHIANHPDQWTVFQKRWPDAQAG
jgi:KDO2-lipid IV(A) lauroyltransferase